MKLVKSNRNVFVKVIMNTGIFTMYSNTNTITCIRKTHDYRILYEYSKIVIDYKYSRIPNTFAPGLVHIAIWTSNHMAVSLRFFSKSSLHRTLHNTVSLS